MLFLKIKKKQLGYRVSEETFNLIEELQKHFQRENVIGSVSKDDVMELAIRTLYHRYVDDTIQLVK